MREKKRVSTALLKILCQTPIILLIRPMSAHLLIHLCQWNQVSFSPCAHRDSCYEIQIQQADL